MITLLSKKQYYNSYFKGSIHDTNNMWKGIKQIINFKPQLSNKFVQSFENNQEILDVLSVANTFNIYFANIGSKL